MRVLSSLSLVFTLGAVACVADADEDGLTNREEKELGLDKNKADFDDDGLLDGDEIALGADPKEPDTDGDGLLDGAERDAGSDPTVPDTDGDGYLDYDEVMEGHDPTDAKDKIYRGNWPYYRYKDELKGGGTRAEEGNRWKRFKMVDQFGEKVDLYDFYNEEGKMIVIDQSAIWCGPCNNMAAFMDGEDLAGYDSIAPVRDAVRQGRMYWITVLIEDVSGGQPDLADLEGWYDEYHTKQIPILADKEYALAEYMPAPGIPAFALLRGNLKVAAFSSSDGFVGLDAAIDAAKE